MPLLEREGVYAAMWNRQREADAALEILQRSEAALPAAKEPVPAE